MPYKKKQASHTKLPTELGKFWEDSLTLLDIFDGYSYSLKVRLAAYDYEHGSAGLLSKLILEQSLLPELATYLVRIVRGEVRREKGRPHGSTMHDALTRSCMYAQIVRWKASGKSLTWGSELSATLQSPITPVIAPKRSSGSPRNSTMGVTTALFRVKSCNLQSGG